MDKLKLKGIWIIQRIRNGKVLDEEIIENTIVADGKERVAKLLNGIETTSFKYLAIGTGTTSPTTSDTSLESEDQRALASTSYESAGKSVLEKTFSFTSSKTITEAGSFDSGTVSGSTMLNRATFTGKAVDATTSLYVKCTITLS